MRHGIALAGAGGLLFVGGFALGWFLHVPKLDTALYAQNRLAAIQQHLDEAAAGFVLLAGDSQSELQDPSDRLCGARIVNGGVSGATASAYAVLLSELDFPSRPSLAVLTIGTNDLARKKKPLSVRATRRFDVALAQLVARLKDVGDHVVVTAVPPLGREIAGEFDPWAVDTYTQRIRMLCERLGCEVADPFAALREPGTGLAVEGATQHGLHLARYRPVLQALGWILCPNKILAEPH